MRDLPERFPLSRAMRHAARAVAYAAKGQTKEARAEQALFDESKQKVAKDATFGNNSAQDILTVEMHLMNGEILLAERAPEAAILHLQDAVKAEDNLRCDEPPDWIQPTRHTLGALFVALGRHHEAAEVYREDLKKLPGNGWSLYGLSVALDGLKQTAAARKARVQFAQAWANADVQIASSCLCIPAR